MKLIAPPRGGMPEFDPAASYAEAFRAATTVNTLTILGAGHHPGIGSVVAALPALGLLPAGSPALRRLAALGERLGIGFPSRPPA